MSVFQPAPDGMHSTANQVGCQSKLGRSEVESAARDDGVRRLLPYLNSDD
jgi:hypothetical protein